MGNRQVPMEIYGVPPEQIVTRVRHASGCISISLGVQLSQQAPWVARSTRQRCRGVRHTLAKEPTGEFPSASRLHRLVQTPSAGSQRVYWAVAKTSDAWGADEIVDSRVVLEGPFRLSIEPAIRAAEAPEAEFPSDTPPTQARSHPHSRGMNPHDNWEFQRCGSQMS